MGLAWVTHPALNLRRWELVIGSTAGSHEGQERRMLGGQKRDICHMPACMAYSWYLQLNAEVHFFSIISLPSQEA